MSDIRQDEIDWQYEVANGDTELGFKEWCEHKQEAELPATREEINGALSQNQSKSKGTPGPWRIGPYYKNDVVSDAGYICRATNETGEYVANARIIATAPDGVELARLMLALEAQGPTMDPKKLNEHMEKMATVARSILTRVGGAA